MAIKQYSLAKDGAALLAPGFRVREFRCKDGSDPIFVDEELVAWWKNNSSPPPPCMATSL